MTPRARSATRSRTANLLGRGGAGFPAGAKWGLLRKAEPGYLVVNGDESEPGTYKDRMLMERDPHQLIEGTLIAAYAVGAAQAFLYVRGEMALAQERIAAGAQRGLRRRRRRQEHPRLDCSVDIVLHRGAGAYIGGEETALLESLEGKRGMPRLKPPFFPAAMGLYQAAHDRQQRRDAVQPPLDRQQRRRRLRRPRRRAARRAPASSRCRATSSGRASTRSRWARPPSAT